MDKCLSLLLLYLWEHYDSLVGKESACNAGDPGSIPGSGRSTGEGIGYPLQYSWASLVAQLIKKLPARERLPTPVFWSREFHGLYSPWGHKESDTTERLSVYNYYVIIIIIIILVHYYHVLTPILLWNYLLISGNICCTKSTLSENSIAIAAFFWLVLTWHVKFRTCHFGILIILS